MRRFGDNTRKSSGVLLRRFLPVLLCMVFLLASTGCTPGTTTVTTAAVQGQYGTYKRFSRDIVGLFNTVISIIGYSETQADFDRYAAMAEKWFTELHQLYDIYKGYDGMTNLYSVNMAAGGAPLAVSPEIIDLLAFCQDAVKTVGNRVDITLGAMLAIWSDYRDAGRANPAGAALPPMESLRAAAKLSGMDALEVDRTAGTVRLAKAGMRIDVGAVAKGFATGIVERELSAAGWGSFLISNGASSISLHGRPFQDGKETWSIGIQNPSALLPEPGQTTAGQENYLAVAQLIDRSIGNSGDYQNYYAVNGVYYNHLIDPDTLMPATTYRGVSVFTDDCAMADLLSSTLFLLPYAEGRALVESLAGVDAIWIYTGGRVEMTPGISAALSTRPPNT